MQRYSGFRFSGLIGASVMALMAAVGWSQPSLTWLGTLRGQDWIGSMALDVVDCPCSREAPRLLVVGAALNYGGFPRAIVWTPSAGMQALPTLTGGNVGSAAFGISTDGLVIVGSSIGDPRWIRPVRWIGNTVADLGTLGGTEGVAFATSKDGSIVVGWADNEYGSPTAFRWENGMMRNLGTLPGRGNSGATGISADGSVIAGISGDLFVAFRWDSASQQMRMLPLPPGCEVSVAYRTSRDGSVIAGGIFNINTGTLEAVRWVDDHVQVIGTLNGLDSIAYDVSADGSIVVGGAGDIDEFLDEYFLGSRVAAIRWTASGGMEDLNITYADLLRDGSSLQAAFGISASGQYIVGWGYNATTGRTEAYLLDTCVHNGDINCDGEVDDNDLLQALFAFGNSGSNLGRVDVNCDRIVDDTDLLIVLFNFGSRC